MLFLTEIKVHFIAEMDTSIIIHQSGSVESGGETFSWTREKTDFVIELLDVEKERDGIANVIESNEAFDGKVEEPQLVGTGAENGVDIVKI